MSRSSSRSSRRSCVALGLVGALVLGARPRALAETNTADRAIAERLYDQGRAQIAQGQVAAACESFAESQRLDPGTGTLLNLAACHQMQGKLASAWVEFREAQAAARREKRPDRVRYAAEHLTAIEPRLAYLTIVVGRSPDGQAPAIKLDHRDLGPAAWGVAIPVDPGSHDVVAWFGEERGWRETLDVRDGQRRTVQVPARTTKATRHAPPKPTTQIAMNGSPAGTDNSPAAPPLATAPEPAPAPAEGQSGRRIAALVAGAAGLAAIGVGSYYAWSASDLWSQRNRACPMDRCTADGVALGQRADSAATVANWTIGGGLAALGVTALLLWWPRGSSSAESRPARASTGVLGGLVTGVWLTPSTPFGLRGTF